MAKTRITNNSPGILSVPGLPVLGPGRAGVIDGTPEEVIELLGGIANVGGALTFDQVPESSPLDEALPLGVPTPLGPGNFFIYARTTGSDTTGDGTLTNPYRTFQRAVLDVPANGPLEEGQFWYIDITDLGVENLPDGYRLPLWQSNGPDFDFDFATLYPPFIIKGRVNIQAIPTTVLSIPAANIVSQVADPVTGLITVTVTDIMVPNEHQGRFLVNQVGIFEEASIVENGVSTFSISTTIPYSGASIEVMTPSAELGSSTGTSFNGLGIFSSTAPVMFSGIKFSNSNPNTFTSAVQAYDVTGVSWALCDINGIHTFPVSRQLATYFCFLRDHTFELRATLAAVLFTGALGTNFARVSAAGDLGACGFSGNYYLGCSNWGHVFEPSDYAYVAFNTLWKNSPGTAAVKFAGGPACRIELCSIEGSSGDGILAYGPGLLFVEGCSGAGNGGFGANIRNGAQVKGLSSNTVTGAGGEVKVGAQPVSTWAAIPAGGIFDEGLAGSTGARVLLTL